MGALLEVADLGTWFYTRQGIVKAVDGVDFQVAAGETLAIVGESGCGKSMTALSLLRLIPDPPGRIVSGTVMLDGQPLNGGILSFSPDAAKGNTYQITGNSPVKDGHYEIQTTSVSRGDTGPGLPPGWYKVILKTPNLSTKKNPQSPVEVNEKYKSVEKTPLSVEVKDNPDPGAYDFKMTR